MQYSIVTYQSLIDSSHSMRMDAEFFRPDYLKVQKQMEKISPRKLIDCQATIKHPKEIARRYVDEGTLFLRAQNVRPMSVELSNRVYVSKVDAHALKDNTLHYKDILITRTGHVGQCAIWLDNRHAIASSHVFIVRSDVLNPFFLAAFLNTRQGQTMIQKAKYGALQPEIAPPYLFQIPIPDWPNISMQIEKLWLQANKCDQDAQHSYKQAEGILLDEMGLVDWGPKHCLSFVRNYADTQQAGRMDADYFQPKYEEIIHAIQSYPGGCDTLENLVTIQKCVEVGSGEYLDDGVPFVRVSNLSPFEITEEKHISSQLYNALKKHQPRSGEILLTKDATPGIAYYLRAQPPKMILSSGILRLKRKTDKINNDYLMLTLNSILTRQQVARDVGGSVILHWRPDQVKGTIIPLLAEDKQIQIQQKVAESFALRRRSKHLLECAKRAVEIAIDQDEQTALAWLKSQTK